ncbi:heme-binding protein [uncultured Desulfovibrio sp.]|uniref:GlcG/HbpS family heme-binding protein n=1 Tax=uncultured Desulfovibrio sp. TaxID=167968 RepID=UPI002612B348|nr:heme-binding protein [uncultured Desulfovibrio sp.]
MKRMLARMAVAAAVLLGGGTQAQAEETTPETQRPVLSTEQAQKMLQAAASEARRSGHAVCITIVDRSGQTLAVLRHHDAGVHTLEASYKKAFTAASQKRRTLDIAQGVREGRIPEDIRFLDARLSLMEGGIPIILAGQVAGGIGVGGAHSAEDTRIAEAGLKTLP